MPNPQWSPGRKSIPEGANTLVLAVAPGRGNTWEGAEAPRSRVLKVNGQQGRDGKAVQESDHNFQCAGQWVGLTLRTDKDWERRKPHRH